LENNPNPTQARKKREQISDRIAGAKKNKKAMAVDQ
jgi:hypothetical protein